MSKKQYSKEKRHAFTDANRKAWDQAAVIHRKINQNKFLKGFEDPHHCDLDPHCVEPLKKVGIAGKSIAQLCCNNGRELLCLKALGAGYCIGFDGTKGFIEQANELAGVSPHSDIDFVVTDIYDIPKAYSGPYDIGLSTIGVIGWMPNLDELFEVYGRLTKPDGEYFVLCLLYVLCVRASIVFRACAS